MRGILPSVIVLSVLFLAVPVAAGAGSPSTPGTPGAEAPGPSGWPALPAGTRALLLVTGADLGHWEPRKCYDHFGGMLYRLAMNDWLFDHEPGIDWHWISAGNVVSLTLENPAVRPPREIYRGLASIGYEVVGVGWRDLQLLGPFSLRAMTRDLPFHVVATNLRVHETGRPFLEESAVIETAAGRVGVLVILPWHAEGVWISPEYGTVVLEPPERLLAPALARLAGRVDRIVLVAQLSWTALRRVLEALPADHPAIDLVIAERGTQGREASRIEAGLPALLVGGYGKLLGRIALGSRGEILEIRGLPVRDRFPIEPATGRPRTGP